jgi:serine/threonine-protein kinase
VDGHTYRIGTLLGTGAFGAVYSCTDEWGNDLVAKVLLPNRSYEDVKQSWLFELNQLVTLRHPNITYVHKAFEWRDTFYLVLERCTFTLETLIVSPGLVPDLWIPWVAKDILQGLEYIHGNGYVHKDIHPGNVYVAQTRDSMVSTKDPVWSFKIGDLGISNLEANLRPNTLMA